MELYDTHAHLFDPQLAIDTAGVIERARQAGVTRMLAVGTTAGSSERCCLYAQQHPQVIRCAAGIHPNHAGEALPGDWARIEKLAALPEVVALGETGLDLYWKDCPLEVQQDYFDRHIRLSQQTGLALVIHLRETNDEILTMLQEARTRGELRGVMHSFTGTAEQAGEFLKVGMHISFAGMLTFKKSDDLRAVAETIPADRLLVETDSPYLTPHPFRSQRPNEPRLVVHTAQCLAETRGITLEELASLTTANALRLFARA
ncbi:TatD family hydrolase [Anatilimnocola sp. NA78]|uniref:TatD family hydrolase n=1 Tax=Anatilimnocola sp. NA78 TaxID=3415683 RepID=UPI003CE463D1